MTPASVFGIPKLFGAICLLLVLSHVSSLPALADERFIRLRHQTISTPPRDATRNSAGLASPASSTPISGLYLIQFTDRTELRWRETLQSQGVQFLHYLPDDAWLVQISNQPPATLAAQPFVRWWGEYRPEFKVHRRLTEALVRRQPGATALGPIKFLISPYASPVEVLALTRRLTAVTIQKSPRWGTIVSATVNTPQFLELVRSSQVLWIEPAPKMKLFDEVSTKIVAGDDGVQGTPATLHRLGFDGSGVTVAVADSGLDTGEIDTLHPDLAGRVDAFFFYGGLPDASDEHSHGTHCAGIIAANAATGDKDDNGYLYGLGVAPNARLVGQRIFDGAGEYFAPPTYETLTRDAVRSGATVGSNSWGDDTQGQYDLSAAEFDALVRDADAQTPGEQPYILEFSAGNSGPASQTIGSPAVAKNVIATGACENNRFGFGIYDNGQEVMADFSSRGPCEDGRFKPDITAPGTWIASVKSQFAGEQNAWAPINENYIYQGGTSQAGPQVSGGCAVVVQWYRQKFGGATPSPALVKALLINSADDMGTAVIPDGEEDENPNAGTLVGDTGPVPNHDEGWGRMNLETLIASERRFDLVEQNTGLSTGQVFERRVVVGIDDQLKVTLVYTDVPGLPAAIPALVNDLDLEVVSPSGELYRGNAFAEGESIAGTPQGDRINNVEGVHLSSPAAGEWILRVRARNVVQDVHGRAVGSPQQDFALVTSGQLPLPGEGIVSWERDAYQAPSVAGVRLVDAQLSAEPSVTVLVSSSSEPNGLNLVLNRASDRGVFTGQVSLALGPLNVADASLQVRHGDELKVLYRDANPVGDRIATAGVDSEAPVVAEVSAANEFGRTTISWKTSEPANARVHFGLSNAVNQTISDAGFREQHKLVLPELIAGESYYYVVISTDRAGNTTTNDNDGRYFRFTGAKVAAALLVYSPESYFADGGLLSDTPFPGIETWLTTLDAIGLDYEVWNTAQRNALPRLADLKPYRVILWRPEELIDSSRGMLNSISTYVEGGGALFVTSFDLLTRLSQPSDGAFKSNILHTVAFSEDQGAERITSVLGEPVGAGLNLELNYDNFPSGFFIEFLGINWVNGPDHLRLATNAAPVFLQEDGRTVGMRFPKTGQDSRGRVVFYSFPFEAVPEQIEGSTINPRISLLGGALEFLVPGLRDSSSIAFDQSAYTVPGSVVVEISDSRRTGQAQLAVQLDAVENGKTNASQSIVLSETVQRGVFRGRFTALPVGAATGPERIVVRPGDTLTAAYKDAVNRVLITQAAIDITKPIVSEVVSEPAYNEATIFWETDKPTDALVRFGESGGDDSFLTRSAYSAEAALSHEVQLRGLIPDRKYFFQVVSRDAAGNVTTDSNRGELYTLRTLKPVVPPWLDTLEGDRTGWAVINDTGLGNPFGGGDDDDDGGFIGSGWAWGVPENSRNVAAHGGTNCWATNLKGDFVDFAITDLISPVVSLVGTRNATLRFWQNYNFATGGNGGGDDDEGGGFGDFSIEAAQLAISTNNGASWSTIYTAEEESSDGWEEVEVDVSKFAGAVVRFRFNYQLFTFTSAAKPGWMIDDISVDTSTIAESAITVSNNLAQARFVIRGPVNVAAGGKLTVTNVPPGEYTTVWSPVDFYITPLAQTNRLETNGMLSIAGIYTMPDTNRNGLSDLWEKKYFNAIEVNRDPRRDTDSDGADDLSEFIAGTDPTKSDSVLKLSSPVIQANRTLKFEWPSDFGRDYQFEISNDLNQWVSIGDRQRGTGSNLTLSLPTLDPRIPYFFRIRVWP